MGKSRREEYLDAVVDEMLEQGRTDLPLVALADAAGTSDRMLVYYFKSRDALLTEALRTIRERRRRRIAAVVDGITTAAHPRDGLASVFAWVTSTDNEAETRLYYGTAGDGLRGGEPFAGYLRDSVHDWVEEGATAARRLGLDEPGATAFGTLLAAATQALSCDRLATGEHERVDAAIDMIVGQLTAVLPDPDAAEPVVTLAAQAV